MTARVYVPGLGSQSGVDFLVDTGADRTVLMPNEARALRLPRPDAQLHIQGSGFGGSAVGTREYVSIEMGDPDLGEYRFGLNADVPRGDSILPSVLGRDVINRG